MRILSIPDDRMMSFDSRPLAELPSPYPFNGDVRCLYCGELVNKRCWHCGASRREGLQYGAHDHEIASR